MPAKLTIRIDQKWIAGKQVLGRCYLEIHEAELAVLLGESGCGKSTLLRILVGLDRDFSGHISFVENTARSNMCGIVFQEPRLLPWMNVLDNVMFALPTNMDRISRKLQAQEALHLVGLSGTEHRLPRELSGGMAQKVAIARALVNLPQVLLLDEPFRALDLHTRLNLHEELLNILSKTRTTALLVTHDIDEAISLGDHIAVMSSTPGAIVSIRTPETPKGSRSIDELSRLRMSLIEQLLRARSLTNPAQVTAAPSSIR